ncbi:hypothetical protein P7K49_010278, partial [Saguinus oedipus]
METSWEGRAEEAFRKLPETARPRGATSPGARPPRSRPPPLPAQRERSSPALRTRMDRRARPPAELPSQRVIRRAAMVSPTRAAPVCSQPPPNPVRAFHPGRGEGAGIRPPNFQSHLTWRFLVFPLAGGGGLQRTPLGEPRYRRRGGGRRNLKEAPP